MMYEGKELRKGMRTGNVGADVEKAAHSKPVYTAVKRVLDAVISCIGLVVLLPVFIITAAAIYLDDKGNPFFMQDRVGKDGKVFKMFKFRSMCMDAEDMLEDLEDLNEADGLAFKIEDDPRITRVGKFIRKTSIDELAQLLNCIIGNMSLVGPRPPLVSEVAQYNDYQRQRLLVTPGITCYWQASGRNDIPFDEWMDLDMKYICERSLWTDLKIILMTVPAVLSRKGAK